LQITLPDNDVVNVRLHACEDCSFIEWSKATGKEVAQTTVSEAFLRAVANLVTSGENRKLPELVAEGQQALGDYAKNPPFNT
jgi:hypothetical protein